MKFNPFEIKPLPLSKCFIPQKKLFPKSYDKVNTSPFTKLRIILMNGTEFENVFFMHNFQRHCTNNDIRRELAVIRKQEQLQQKRIGLLKPIDESILETTISYEQLAIELTAILAQREPDYNVKRGLDFALLEDFDHLYRFSNLLDMEAKKDAKTYVGGLTEIMPGRPTIAEHRHPYDDVRAYTNYQKADAITKLNTSIITAAEQQTMNFYMNVAPIYKTELGRKLFGEIGLIEEQHVTQYGSLMDASVTMLECLLMHEYVECYLYWSCALDEENEYIKTIWEEHLQIEIAHLHKVAEMLEKYEGKHYTRVIPNGEFPEPLRFGSNKEYIRKVLESVNLTSFREEYIQVNHLPKNADFFKYQSIINKNVNNVPSHKVINMYINKNGEDYRYQDKPHPIKDLQNRKIDNTEIGR
ncbi:MAG: hypothetical protein ACI4TX_02965 [Christensenellales bacterium]